MHPGLERLEPNDLVAGLERGELRGCLLHLAAHAMLQLGGRFFDRRWASLFRTSARPIRPGYDQTNLR